MINKKYLNISEVSKMLQIKEHKIRYWDSIDLKTNKLRVDGISTKSKGGTRYFNKENIQKLNENYFIYTWSDLNKSLFSALKVERNVMFIILSLIIIVAAFNIISGLTILIKNKTKEIAILKTLGFTNRSIKKTFFLTGLTIGFFATLSGILLGILFSVNIEKIRIFLSKVLNLEIFPSDIYFLDELPYEINFYSILIIFIISLIISAIASYLPATKISKMNTFRALRYE